MDADTLRQQWPTISPRERDARVAEALGFKLWQSGKGSLGSPQRQTIATDSPGSGWRHLPFSRRWEEDDPRIPPYSTSWEHAGPLLDRLRSDGWCVRLEAAPLSVLLELSRPPGFVIGLESETGPDAIALAFVLAHPGAE